MWFLWLLVFLPAISALTALIKFFWASYFSDGVRSNKKAFDGKIHIFLPAFLEQTIVEETLDYFDDLIRKQSNVELYTVTNINEPILDDVKTTYDLICDYIEDTGTSRVQALHYQGPLRGKSYQLNDAFNKLLSSGSIDAEKDYVLVYDFDGRPEKETIGSYIKAIENNHPDIIQQPVIPCLNYDKTNLFGQADSLLHVIRAYASELFMWRFVNVMPMVVSHRIFDTYCIGCGLCVKAKRIKEHGFPEPVDDIYLGFLGASKKWSFSTINPVCGTQAYPSFTNSFKSRKIIFHAYFQSFTPTELKNLGIGHLFSGSFLETLKTLFLGWVWLTAVALYIIYSGYLIAVTSAILLYAILKAVQLYVAARFAQKNLKSGIYLRIEHFMLAPFQWFWRWLPAFASLISFIRTSGKLTITKTERS